MTQSLNSAINLTTESYLVIVYGKSRFDYAIQDFTPKQKRQIEDSQNLLNEAGIDTGIAGKIGTALWTSPMVQNFASKALPNAVLGRVNSSLYDIMADGKISNKEVGRSFIDNCTNILDSTAIKMGLPTPTTLYKIINPDGTTIADDVMNLFSKEKFCESFSESCQEENEENKNRENERLNENNEILKFKLVTKDTESWDIDIPTRKTEKGLYLSPIIGNQNRVKTFSIVLVDNPNKGLYMYDMKERLYFLRDIKEKFDIYIYDSDVAYIERIRNCVFSNISLDVQGKNSLTLDVSITQIPEYQVKIDTNLDKGIQVAKTTTSGKKNPTKNNATKSANKDTKPQSQFQQYSQQGVYNSLNTVKDMYQSEREIYQNPKFSQERRKEAKDNMEKYVNQATNYVNTTVTKTKAYKDWTPEQMKKAFEVKHDFKAP